MAPIYTAQHVSSTDTTIPLFTVKGLHNMAPSSLTTLDLFGISLKRQVAFTQYADNIASFIHANVVQKRVIVGCTPLSRIKTELKLPLDPPEVQFVLQKEVNYEQAEKFLKNLGTGATKWKTGKTTIFKSPALPDSMDEQLLRVIAPHYNCGRDAVTPPGIVAYRFLSSAIAHFLRIHTYAAFPTLTGSITQIGAINSAEISGTKYLAIKVDGEVKISNVRESSKFLQENYHEEEDEEMEVDDSEVRKQVEKMLNSPGAFFTTGQDAVLTAKPSPITADVNIGSSSEIPNMPGLLFPYFHGLIKPDPSIMKKFIVQRLFQLLGSTVKDCQDRYLDIRRGINSLSTTTTGMVMSHIVLGVDLALQTQTRCFLIIESRTYKGFSLLGGNFSIFDSNRFHAPCAEGDLRKDIMNMDPHLSSVNDLTSVLSEMAVSGKYTGPEVSTSTFDEPENLIPVIEGLKLSELETEEEQRLNALFRSLNYIGTGYIQKNPQLVAETLETFYSESIIRLERPTYFPSVRAPVGSREFAVLSRFGPDAPSLWNEKGQLFKCEAREAPATSVGGKRKLGQLDPFANMPEKILITPKPLSIAVRDFVKVNEQGGVRIDLKERAGKYRNISVEAEDMRKRIWEILVNGLHDSNKKRKVDSVKKVDASKDFDELFADLL